jgi:RNA polymerase sigma-70 factor (ECF subfamily)
LDDVPADSLPWLLGTARRVLANHARSRGRWLALRERAHAQAAGLAVSEPTSSDGTVLRALAGLRPIDREALLLVAWEGLEPARAAQALGVRPGTFAVRLHRARQRFAAALAAAEQGQALDRRPTNRMEMSS